MSSQIQTSTTVFRNSAPSTASQRLFPLRTVAVRQETSTAWRGVRCSGVDGHVYGGMREALLKQVLHTIGSNESVSNYSLLEIILDRKTNNVRLL
ncbi:hypothetical protein Bca52824_019542 [Brassica carinata]|uniref:Uncharacterized protein n=1 Tax=Brassica carinata TaxID=52824 RepID=A0A8X8AYP1_BRACI|nr:hypothetical protein Bca52824_019542 [Brassica carinata]